MHDYSFLCVQVTEIAKKAGEFIRKEKGKITSDSIETKSLHSYVTYVDKNAERMIVDELKQILPKVGFITEEETEIGLSDTIKLDY